MATQISWPPVLGSIEMLGEVRDSESIEASCDLFCEF